jgi:hypothetical protein
MLRFELPRRRSVGGRAHALEQHTNKVRVRSLDVVTDRRLKSNRRRSIWSRERPAPALQAFTPLPVLLDLQTLMPGEHTHILKWFFVRN